MKQTHQAIFWGEHSPQIHLYQLTATNNDAPAISVAISFGQDFACLSYFIEPTDWLHLTQAGNQSTRQDYLWEQNCLECFFEFANQADYTEMNFAPNPANDGNNHYNLYHFDDYRTPNTLPPKQTSGQVVAILEHLQTDNTHAYHLKVSFNHNHVPNISKINPCVILYQDNQPIFYATHHANPPDFHNKAFWQAVHTDQTSS